jgi:D-alanyl-D-alanine carboxypeptidase/D-alanyl-D-alanine-endopeptidase (penicillin-binding protein 4)
MRTRRIVTLLLASLVAAGSAAPARAAIAVHARQERAATAEPWWERRVDEVIGGRAVSVAIGVDGTFWYRHQAWMSRVPASNEKLLLSMALLAALGPDRVIATRAMSAAAPVDGVVDGDLWLVGHGDPEVGTDRLGALANAVAHAGVTRIRGSVVGDTGPFLRDWWAPGWKDDFPADEVAFPTALTFRGNVGPSGGHIADPELRAAAALTRALRRHGVAVGGRPEVDTPHRKPVEVASVTSAPVSEIIRRMDVDSINFDAEVLGKLLGGVTSGAPSIAGAAAAIDAFTSANGAPGFVHRDASGLSYDDRVTARGILRLLWAADQQPWGPDLRSALPIGGQGTLTGRLGHVRVRAKTGTLTDISALSGWLWSDREDGWVAFSILDAGMEKDEAMRIEDAIVGLVSAAARPPGAGR